MQKRRNNKQSVKTIKDQQRFTLLGVLLVSLMLAVYFLLQNRLDNRSRAQIQDPSSIKLRTLTIPPISITITYPPLATNPPYATIPNVTRVQTSTGLITGGPVSPDAPYYCIDDEDPDGCDDNTAFWVPKGTGGSSGTCGTVIEQAHKLVAALPQEIKYKPTGDSGSPRDRLNFAVSNCGYTTGPQSSGYLSTYFVIDAYNLAGIAGLSKTEPSHVSGTNLLSWWQSSSASSMGYSFISYSPTVLAQHASSQLDLTGCVVFLNLNSGVHVGIFNVLEVVNGQGDGVLSVLQANALFYLDRFEVVGWNVMNTPLHQTKLSSVAGFGCHQ